MHIHDVREGGRVSKTSINTDQHDSYIMKLCKVRRHQEVNVFNTYSGLFVVQMDKAEVMGMRGLENDQQDRMVWMNGIVENWPNHASTDHGVF